MERLGLERKLKESERKVQMLASSRESILSQMTQLGQKCSAVKKQLDEATLQMESVEKSGKNEQRAVWWSMWGLTAKCSANEFGQGAQRSLLLSSWLK